jgi:thioredoxin 1
MKALSLTEYCDLRLKTVLPGVVVMLLLVSMLAPLGCQKAPESSHQASSSAAAPTDNQGTTPVKGLPRLLDLGATKCVPCKMMAPILEELEEQYAGSLEVVFIDVWENRDAAAEYGIESIPTQIFFDASGNELFRHMGFISKEDILAKWEELGVELPEPPAEKPSET